METPSSLTPRLPALHKRRHVADTLRTLVAGLSAGDRLPSVAHLERHFGVAKSTVEAAVGELQAEGLIVRRHGSGTYVAESLRPTDRARSGRLVVTSTGQGNSVTIFSLITAALSAELRRLGYDTLFVPEADRQRRLALAQERWEAGAADGYVHVGSLDGVEFPSAPGLVIGEVPDGAPVHQVVVDNYGGGRRAGEYLWGLGHRRVAFLAMHDFLPARLRFRGLADALHEHGGGADAVHVPLAWSGSAQSDIPNLETALRSLLDTPTPPTTVFFGNDQVAFPGLQTLVSWGVRVPGDLSVISFDDTPGLASHTRPALTGLRMPIDALAALTAQTLHQALHTPDLPPQRLRLPAELVVRESAGPLPSDKLPK